MIGATAFSPGEYHGAPGREYKSKIEIWREVVPNPANPNSGFLGEPSAAGATSLQRIVNGYPAFIVSHTAMLVMAEGGLTEIARFKMYVPYKQRRDRTFIIQARDIVVEKVSKLRYLVITSHDPGSTRQEIVSTLEHGPAG